MKTFDIQTAITIHCKLKHCFVIPNIHLSEWWECDVLAVLPSGFTVEYEVKISRSDFFNDAKKEKQVWGKDDQGWKKNKQHKYSQLGNKDVNAPNRFYYVVPENLIKVEEVPTWAGLIYAKEYKYHRKGDHLFRNIFLDHVKDAPLIHKKKRENVVEQVKTSAYYRFLDKIVEDRRLSQYEEQWLEEDEISKKLLTSKKTVL